MANSDHCCVYCSKQFVWGQFDKLPQLTCRASFLCLVSLRCSPLLSRLRTVQDRTQPDWSCPCASDTGLSPWKRGVVGDIQKYRMDSYPARSCLGHRSIHWSTPTPYYQRRVAGAGYGVEDGTRGKRRCCTPWLLTHLDLLPPAQRCPLAAGDRHELPVCLLLLLVPELRVSVSRWWLKLACSRVCFRRSSGWLVTSFSPKCLLFSKMESFLVYQKVT